MAVGSQYTTAELLSEIQGLVHDIFKGDVQQNVRRESNTAMLFRDAQQGQYELVGNAMKFAADYRFANGAMASSGLLPDHIGLDPVQGSITPIRRYRRIAMDNFIEKRATGAGAFQDFGTRIFDILWDSWKSMEIRHSIGASSCLIGVVESRSSSTVFVIADAYGNSGSNPLAVLSEGTILAWYDQTATAGIDGAGIISSINYSTRAITMDSATTWEPGDQIAAGDYIYLATTNNISRDYFEAERNLGPNGLGTIVDPAAALSTVFGIAEATYPRSKPYRKASVTCDHLEFQEHWLQLGAKRGFSVSPQTDVVITHPVVVAQVARSLMGYQQQAYTGSDLKGGYTGVTVGGIPFVEDPFFYHNVAMTVFKQALIRATLGGDADINTADGQQFQRIGDFDGREAYASEYMQTFHENRGANSALTAITTDLTTADFDPVPNY